jgi:hypothetical protein
MAPAETQFWRLDDGRMRWLSVDLAAAAPRQRKRILADRFIYQGLHHDGSRHRT